MRRRGPRAGKRDANHDEIVRKLRQMGASVLDLSSLGCGAPDICVGWKGKAYFFEIKTQDGRLDAGQVKWAKAWRGPTVWLVCGFTEVLMRIEPSAVVTCFR